VDLSPTAPQGDDKLWQFVCRLTNPSSLSDSGRSRRRAVIPALPFCHVVLTGKRPVHTSCSKPLKTLGDHLRKKRLELGLLQREVAERLRVTADTVRNWEGNATTPICQYHARILHFLGYDPFPKPQTLAQQLVQYRNIQGLSQRQFAKRLRVDQGALGRWERGERRPDGKFLARVESFLNRHQDSRSSPAD
jgi:transcriptional regulator with XRE-family HTH domain